MFLILIFSNRVWQKVSCLYKIPVPLHSDMQVRSVPASNPCLDARLRRCGYPFHHNEYACLGEWYRMGKADAILAEFLTGRKYDATINEGFVFWGTSHGIWQTEVKAESGIDGCLYFREDQPMGGVVETCQYRMDVWHLSPSAVVGNEQGHLKTIGSLMLDLRLRFHQSHFCGLCLAKLQEKA